GGVARQICREASEICLITGETLGNDAELHHPVRDGRPPVLLSKLGHQAIEGQSSASSTEDPVEKVLRPLRKQNHQSWAQLRRGCMDLGSAITVKSNGTSSNARTFARNARSATNLTYEAILAWLDAK